MNEQLRNQIFFRHSLCWGAAFITPPIVMVVLDLFDRHTPNAIALCSTLALMFVFVISNSLLVKGLEEAAKNEPTQSEGDQ